MSSQPMQSKKYRKPRRAHMAHHHLTYNTDEVRDLYGVTANTVSNWVKIGLPCYRADKNLFRGCDLNEFHDWQRKRRQHHMSPHEVYCFTCKEARSALVCEAWINADGPQTFFAIQCVECGRSAQKFISADDIPQYQRLLNQKNNGERLDYNTSSLPSDFGNLVRFEARASNASNLKMLYAYQKHLEAKRFDPKTVLSAMAHIASYLDYIGGRNIEKSTLEQVSQFKSHLFSRVTKNNQPVSASTITHTLASLKSLYLWMRDKHDGPDLAEYFVPDRRIKNAMYETKERSIPTVEELSKLIADMPHGTFYELRDRAVLAFLFLTGVRIAALLSLKRKHIDTTERSTFQDPNEVDTKNSKTIHVKWFPVPAFVEQCFLEYWEAYCAITEDNNAPLFPKAYNRISLPDNTLVRVEPLRTQQKVRDIIREACERSDVTAFHPHQIRKTLAIMRLQLNLTAKQNKAFSQNLGHERIETTDQHYSKLSRDEQFAAMEKIPRFGEERSERDKLAAMVRTAPDGIMPALKAILEFAGSN
jgi:integrase